MSVTLVAINKIKNKEVLMQYREKAGSALAKHGGSVVNAGPIVDTLEGERLEGASCAVIAFPSNEQAQAWISDPELQDVHALRNSAGDSQIFLLG